MKEGEVYFVKIDGKKRLKIVFEEGNHIQINRMPGCSIGDYFSGLSLLVDYGIEPK